MTKHNTPWGRQSAFACPKVTKIIHKKKLTNS